MRHFPPVPGIVAFLVLIWGVASLVHLAGTGFAGYTTDGNHTVLEVSTDGSAAGAGLMAGDRIVSIDDIEVTDTPRLVELGRPGAGEVRQLIVERNNNRVSLSVPYQAATPAQWVSRLAGVLLGMTFLAFPMWASVRRPGRATSALLMMGVGLGLGFMGDALDATGWIDRILMVVRHGVVLAGVGSMLLFQLLYPYPRRFVTEPVNSIWLFLPLLFYWVLLAWRIGFEPQTSGFLNHLTNVGGSGLVAAYGVATLITALRSYIRHRSWPSPNGPRWILFSGLVGLAPLLVASLTAAVAPDLHLPAQGLWFLSLALIPIGWSMAAVLPMPERTTATKEH